MNLGTITGIHSCPRSGSTWLLNIFNSAPTTRCLYQPLFSYSHKNQITPTSTTEDLAKCWGDFYHSSDEFALMQSDWFRDDNGKHRHPQFTKIKNPEHLVFKHVRFHNLILPILERDPQIRMIALVRDPRATISSFLSCREFCSQWDELQQWRLATLKNQLRPEEFYGFERWKAATRIFLEAENRYPSRFKLIRYIDLLEKTEDAARSLFEFCQIEWDDATREFIFQSRRRSSDAYGVFRQKQNDLDWQSQLNPQISAAIESDLEKLDNRDLRQFLDTAVT